MPSAALGRLLQPQLRKLPPSAGVRTAPLHSMRQLSSSGRQRRQTGQHGITAAVASPPALEHAHPSEGCAFLALTAHERGWIASLLNEVRFEQDVGQQPNQCQAVSTSFRRAKPAPVEPGSRGQAVVVGAGPAGVVAAMLLARQGFAVKVLERRGDPTASEAAEANKQTFIMALMPRGIGPLRDLGVRLPESTWINGLAPAKGAVMHMPDGGKMLRPHPEGNVTVERAALAVHLVQEARRLYPAIEFQFNADIQAFDLQNRSITLQGQNGSSGSPQPLKYDLLIGADGVGSQVRAAVEAGEPNFSSSRTLSNTEYFVARDLPAISGIDPEDDRDMAGRYVHMFSSKAGFEGAIAGMGAYVHEDDTYNVALQLRRGTRPPDDAAEWQAALEDALPSAPKEWVRSIAQQTAGQVPRSWGSTISSSHLAVPWAGVALVGDAGHGVTPNLGQGCNAALETVAILDRVLEVNKDKDLAFSLSEYNRVRKPDMDALRYLDTISGRIWGGGSQSIWDVNWAYVGTMANILVSGTLHKLMPRVWEAPAMLNGFTRKATEYSYIVWCRRRDLAILVCAAIAAVVLGIESVAWLVSA